MVHSSEKISSNSNAKGKSSRFKLAVVAAISLFGGTLIGPGIAQAQVDTECVFSGGGWLCVGSFGPAPQEAGRIAGEDRYETSVELCKSAYPNGQAPTVYMANGVNGADALSAGITIPDEGCLLLVPTGTSLPGVVLGELQRHTGANIIAIGGVNSVSDEQVNAAIDAVS